MANEGLVRDSLLKMYKNVIILVVTVAGRGPHPTDTIVLTSVPAFFCYVLSQLELELQRLKFSALPYQTPTNVKTEMVKTQLLHDLNVCHLTLKQVYTCSNLTAHSAISEHEN